MIVLDVCENMEISIDDNPTGMLDKISMEDNGFICIIIAGEAKRIPVSNIHKFERVGGSVDVWELGYYDEDNAYHLITAQKIK